MKTKMLDIEQRLMRVEEFLATIYAEREHQRLVDARYQASIASFTCVGYVPKSRRDQEAEALAEMAQLREEWLKDQRQEEGAKK